MRRWSYLASIALLIVIVVGGGIGLYSILHAEPVQYVRSEVPPGEERVRESHKFEQKAFDLINEIQFGEYTVEFTAAQINSWLAEDFVETNLAKQLPPEISDPRVSFEPGRIFIAFRYGGDAVNTIVSIQAKVWMVRREINVVALEIEKLRAGALPLTPKVLQDRITEWCRGQNVDVQWYRNEGNPVAILRFQYDRREPSVQLQELELREGSIYLKGRSLDPEFQMPKLGETSAKSH